MSNRKKNSIFDKLGKIIDKIIVIPITKLVVKINKKLNKPGSFLESWLSKTNTLLFISLVIAVIIFIGIDQKILLFSESSAELLRKQPVNVIYNAEKYVVEGLPETVDITLIGSKADLYIAKQAPTRDVTIDLTSLKSGQHKVEIKYDQAGGSIDYKVNPSTVTVYVYPKISDTRTVTIDLLNQDKLDDKLVITEVEIINNVQIDSEKVYIKGSESQLKKVATVKALIDINNIARKEVGTTTLKDVPLKAYDEEGNVINVEIVPTKVDTNITIESPNRKIPIKIIPIGEVAFGKAISSITTNETEVIVYGTEESLTELKFIPIEINVQDIKEKTTFKSEITKPAGIKSMSINTITSTILLDNVSDKDIVDVNIDVRNLNDQYLAQGLSGDDIKVTVNVKGVESVIESIAAKDINAFVDLNGLGEGEHEVEVQVEGSDVRVKYLSKSKTVKIRIAKKG